MINRRHKRIDTMKLQHGNKVHCKGPSREEFLLAYADKKNTLVLNLEILRSSYMQYTTENNPEYKLNARINACKHHIQVHGYKSAIIAFNGIYDSQHKNFVHHHFTFNTTTLILEYYVIDAKTVLLTQLAPHENFKFGQTSMQKIDRICASDESKKIKQKSIERQINSFNKLKCMLQCKNIDAESVAKIRSTMS